MQSQLPREIRGHEINECNEAIVIRADEQSPANGNASHYYELSYPDPTSPECTARLGLKFQDGPIGLVGVNGITGEALLAVLIDRLQCFQSSQWACQENADALTALELARDALHTRTKKRLERGVEGTHAV